jgi:hypothetical protein
MLMAARNVKSRQVNSSVEINTYRSLSSILIGVSLTLTTSVPCTEKGIESFVLNECVLST